jgi:ATP-dependent DNA helicase DinG
MSVIFTSATLAAGKSFEYFSRGCGLDKIAPELWSAVQLESSYDFEHNMAVYLPTDMPEPTARGYRDALEELIFAVHTALGGSTLTLFTNRRDMELLYERLAGRLAVEDIMLRCQTRGFSPKRLRDDFLENRSLSLFALRSFWEGFDAPGDTLRCVIIPKLPFGKPNDPLMLERESRGENAWKNYSLPEAIIDLKQAAGRLIRSSTDSGSLVLADARLLTKWYGRAFLDALPSRQRYTLDTQALADRLRMSP